MLGLKEKMDSSYIENRNKKKAFFISISVFLYIIGTFSIPYMIEALEYNELKAVMIGSTLWRYCNSYANLLFRGISKR